MHHMTKLIGYSFVPSGAVCSSFSSLLTDTTTSDFFGTFSDSTIPAQIKAAGKMWSDNCDMLFIQVPDPGGAVNATVAATVPNQVRLFAATMAYDSGFSSRAGSLPGAAYYMAICINKTACQGIYANMMQEILAHEYGHTVFNMVHPSPVRFSSIMNPSPALPVQTAIDSTDITNAQTGAGCGTSAVGPAYGVHTTTPSKVAAGTALGEIYSAYKGARGLNGFGVGASALTDNQGLLFWHNSIAAGAATLATLTDALVGTGLTTASFTTQFYHYALGRDPTSAEITSWATATKSQVLQAVAVAAGTYRQTLFPAGSNLWFS